MHKTATITANTNNIFGYLMGGIFVLSNCLNINLNILLYFL